MFSKAFSQCTIGLTFHVTQDTNFENFSVCPNFTFNIRKSHKISDEKSLYFRSYQQKTSRGGGTPPVPLGLRD